MTVIPVPENDAIAPLAKLAPTTVTFWAVAPCPSDDGLVDDTVGPALTLKHPVHEPDAPPGSVTVTSREPMVADVATETFAVTWLESTKLVELTVIPVPENDAAAPLTKLVPVTVTFWLAAPCPRDDGAVDVTVGGGPFASW